MMLTLLYVGAAMVVSYVCLSNLPPRPPVRKVREAGLVMCANCGAERPMSEMMRLTDTRAPWELYGNLVCRRRCTPQSPDIA